MQKKYIRYVHKALANTFFARKATGTIKEGELKLLDKGIKPILSHTSDGKRIRHWKSHALPGSPPHLKDHGIKHLISTRKKAKCWRSHHTYLVCCRREPN
ncbi:unnamed protein product [Microthlaspi erraticum]|uniref:Arabidopsis retrotransposon Orf1 C-terminal domain-containing protein n=1 Tax=Microthlaspi erraticum TaxID=1685480 RepID=A0A6D2JB71_9BRAS|nr:unnamed protein product [Microthlaspi erraticum]